MSLIIDANASALLRNRISKYEQLHAALFKTSSSLKLFFGGGLVVEYERAGVFAIVVELARAGRAIRVTDQRIDSQFEFAKTHCSSNDVHVIALARAESRARVLVSDDAALVADFKNKRLVDKPRGKIYSPTRHQSSLHLKSH